MHKVTLELWRTTQLPLIDRSIPCRKTEKCAAVFTLHQIKLGNPTYEAGTLAFRVPARMQANPA